jgi:hypothetical protein
MVAQHVRRYIDLLTGRYHSISSIWLMGSRASSTERPESDWDLSAARGSGQVGQRKDQRRAAFGESQEEPLILATRPTSPERDDAGADNNRRNDAARYRQNLGDPSSSPAAGKADHQNIFSMECRHSERTRVAKYLQVNSSTGVFYKK